jgi:hypothetical protein
MLARTRQGRVATPAAWSHLGLEMGGGFELGGGRETGRKDDATLFDGL